MQIIRNLVGEIKNLQPLNEWEAQEPAEISKFSSSPEDFISAIDLARMLGKSPSWCYANAAELGASRIGGSIIFRRSTLKEALDNARMESRKKKDPAPIPKKKLKPQAVKPQVHQETDPAVHGLYHLLSLIRSKNTYLN